MTPRELEHYLHQHIPLSSAMQASVDEISPDRVVLGAPLLPNINHRETVFGGSASALCILAAWSLLYTRLAALGHESRLVIQRNTMSYEKPIAGRFTAHAPAPPTEAWNAFMRTLERRGRARIVVSSTLRCDGQIAGHFEGAFVAAGSAGD